MRYRFWNIFPAQAKELAHLSDGVIVGSAIVKLIADHGKRVYHMLRNMCGHEDCIIK